MRSGSWWIATLLMACHGGSGSPAVSSTLALTSDDRALWVVTPDADSVSVIDPVGRKLLAEIPLGAAPPAVDATTQRFEPSVKPRALAILPGDQRVYVAGQTADRVFVIDAATRRVRGSIAVGAAPTAVVAAPDGDAVYVVSHEAATVSKIDPRTDQLVATLAVGEHPWGAAISADGRSLYVTQFLLHPGVTVVDTRSFTVRNVVELAEQPPDVMNGKLVPNGVARGAYAAVPRPGAGDVWLPHVLLAVKTPEPDLDFQSTVFPSVSTLSADGRGEDKRLLFKPLTVSGVSGAFDDVISGPRALAFTPDGKLALLANAGSEDVMVFDGVTGNEVALVRPLPAAFLEGITVDHAGRRAYVDGRNTHNVVVLSITPADPVAPVVVDGEPIDRVAADPMPDELRLGQRLFYSANSAAFPVTQNFWVSCSTCHLEGATDAVTWLFTVGPRDTPSNAGGPINTGFLLRQALRNSVVDYDQTIDVEQGGNFHRTLAAQETQLAALAAFVNYAIPFPQNPNRSPDGSLTAQQQHGATLFGNHCSSCHPGPYLTDSGAGNPMLDENGPVTLHDVGTCVRSGAVQDQPAADEVVGKMHTACDFDTPTLRGLFATAPYFHDGSAATIADAVERLPAAAQLSTADKADLVAYLGTL
jgi:YVTN family beta-propeller protein